MNLKIIAPGAGAAIAIIVVFVALYGTSQPIEISQTTDTMSIQESDGEIMVTDGVKHLIPLDKIRGGGPPKDGIPSIDDPIFASSDAEFVSDSDTVIGLEINGEAKAYPLFIMVWHEIVNDKVGGVPVAVTYCPLCYTNQVFKRVINDQPVEFGTSGKLYNSNLLMYDRLTDSYWSQALGVAVKGELTGETLEIIPFDVITWGDWKILHPDTVVLTTQTGHTRAYGADPYGNYYTDNRIMFPIENTDDRMHPKEIILGFHIDDVYKAYKQFDLQNNIIINDQIGNTPILLTSFFNGNARAYDRTVDGQVLDFEIFLDSESNQAKIMDTQTGSFWNYFGVATSGDLEGKSLERLAFSPGFWFEWIAFHPETLVYGFE